MTKRSFIILLISSLAFTSVFAENKWDHVTWRNEIRVGWGDQLFESLMWHNPTYIVNTMPTTWQQVYHENYHHDQHIWLEYQWRFKEWVSFGGMLDISEVHWDDVTRNGAGAEIAREPGHYFYNLVIMPTVRFTYFHHPYVNLYSGLGFGVGINGGTETDSRGKYTDAGVAINVTLFGVSANYQRWFATFDIGGMYSLKNANTIFMASSRILNVGIGARF